MKTWNGQKGMPKIRLELLSQEQTSSFSDSRICISPEQLNHVVMEGSTLEVGRISAEGDIRQAMHLAALRGAGTHSQTISTVWTTDTTRPRTRVMPLHTLGFRFTDTAVGSLGHILFTCRLDRTFTVQTEGLGTLWKPDPDWPSAGPQRLQSPVWVGLSWNRQRKERFI